MFRFITRRFHNYITSIIQSHIDQGAIAHAVEQTFDHEEIAKCAMNNYDLAEDVAHCLANAQREDLPILAGMVDIGKLAAAIDLKALAKSLDMDDIKDYCAESLDAEEMASNLSISDIAGELDLSDIASEFDADEVASHLDYRLLVRSLLDEIGAAK